MNTLMLASYSFCSSSALSSYFFRSAPSSLPQASAISDSSIVPFFSATNKLYACFGFTGMSTGFSGRGMNRMPFFSFLMTLPLSAKRLLMGTLMRFASARYSFHIGFSMYSLTWACHSLNFSIREVSYSFFVALSSFMNSTLYALTSSALSFLPFGAPSASSSAFRLSPTNTAKPVFGGAGGECRRNLRVMTFMASFMNSVWIFFSLPLYFLNSSDSLNAANSLWNFCLASASFLASSAFSSAGASMNFAFKALRPLPSPLPAGTSVLCASANIANTDWGLFGKLIRPTVLFSLSLALRRSKRKSRYVFLVLNSSFFLSNSFFMSSTCEVYLAFSSAGTWAHFSAQILAISGMDLPFSSSANCGAFSFLHRDIAVGAFLGAPSSFVLMSFFCFCLLSRVALSAQNFLNLSDFLYSAYSTRYFSLCLAAMESYSPFLASLVAAHSSAIFLPMSDSPPPAAFTSSATLPRTSAAKSM
mmetsp:Transcript_3483/g.9807  ORF Transcript_3483/g.9807 Transcript_3483/m.9807 type:complete len:475 (+) Transcript_3483:2051-3475(+)